MLQEVCKILIFCTIIVELYVENYYFLSKLNYILAKLDLEFFANNTQFTLQKDKRNKMERI